VWDVWNEPHLEPASYFPDRMYCYCDASLARFVEWLRAKYTTLDALNLAWSRRFSAWDQVAPPRVFEAVPDLIDWRSFWFDNLRSWLERRSQVVRKVSSRTPVMTHVALSGFTGQLATHTLDEFTLTRDIDIFGTSSFPTWLMADDHVEHLLNLDTARDAAEGKPFWQAELQGGRGRRAGAESTGQPRPEVVRLWIWNALAAGATGVMFWQWRPELLGPESPGYGLTTPDGGRTARLDAVAEMAGVARIPELEGRTAISGPVGLVVSRLTALHAFATDRSMDMYRDAVMGAYRLLLDVGASPMLVHEDQLATAGVPAGLTTLYWPMPAVASDGLLDLLASFVESGGTLVAEASPGEYDERGYRRTTVPGGPLTPVFGAVERETDTAQDLAAPVGGHVMRGAWQMSRLDAGEATVRSRFSTGEPAVLEHEFGQGRSLLIATYPSLAYHRSHDAGTRAAIAQLLTIDEAANQRWDEPAPGLLIRRSRTSDGRELVFALNWTPRDADLRLDNRMTVLAPVDASGEPWTVEAAVSVPGMTGFLLLAGR
jgi:beta-galactosidase